MKKSLRSITMLAVGSLLVIAGTAQAKHHLSPEEQMAHALSLTEEQQLQIADAKQDFDETLHAAKLEFKGKVDAVLTEEQKAKRDEMAEKIKAHMAKRKQDRMMKMRHHSHKMGKGEGKEVEKAVPLKDSLPKPVALPVKVSDKQQ